MTHKATERFWSLYKALPDEIRSAANQAFELLKSDVRHPSLHFKKLGSTDYWSARITRSYRSFAVMKKDICLWIWIGSHSDYDQIIKGK